MINIEVVSDESSRIINKIIKRTDEKIREGEVILVEVDDKRYELPFVALTGKECDVLLNDLSKRKNKRWEWKTFFSGERNVVVINASKLTNEPAIIHMVDVFGICLIDAKINFNVMPELSMCVTGMRIDAYNVYEEIKKKEARKTDDS